MPELDFYYRCPKFIMVLVVFADWNDIVGYVQEFYWQSTSCIGFSFLEFSEDQPRMWFILSHVICYKEHDFYFGAYAQLLS